MKFNTDFIPNWKSMGLKSQAAGIAMVFRTLLDHQKNIINLGFHDTHNVSIGDNGVILKGKNPGRKKDRKE